MELHDRRLGENLRRIRLNAHLTQKAISEKLGYTSSEHWSRIESGERHIPLHTLDRFCCLMNVSYEEVLRGATEASVRGAAGTSQTRIMRNNSRRSSPTVRETL